MLFGGDSSHFNVGFLVSRPLGSLTADVCDKIIIKKKNKKKPDKSAASIICLIKLLFSFNRCDIFISEYGFLSSFTVYHISVVYVFVILWNHWL